MKHIKRVTAAKAAGNGTDFISELLDQIFAFVLELLDSLGKSQG